MPRDNVRTLQSNIKNNSSNMQDYSLFLGGLNVKRAALEQYDVLKRGKGRIFFTKMPYFMKELMPNASRNFKHIIEYTLHFKIVISKFTYLKLWNINVISKAC